MALLVILGLCSPLADCIVDIKRSARPAKRGSHPRQSGSQLHLDLRLGMVSASIWIGGWTKTRAGRPGRPADGAEGVGLEARPLEISQPDGTSALEDKAWARGRTRRNERQPSWAFSFSIC
jgi:hypothetical protein